jgi:hypothetical protein
MTRNRFGERPSFRLPCAGLYKWLGAGFYKWRGSSVLVLAAMVMVAGSGIMNDAHAQLGKISAKVLDAKSGEPLTHAVVQIVQNRLGALSKDNGIATIINVPPDEDYTVVAKYPGYLPDTTYHVKVQSDITTSLSYKLGTKQTVVTVTAQAPMVEKTKTDISTKFDQTELATMPGRQRLDEVIMLTPGAVQDVSSGGISFHGGRGTDNSFLLNGANVTDPLSGQATSIQYAISRLAISEVDIVTGSADASKGGFTGGEVNAQTRAGGTDLNFTAHYRTEIPSLFGDGNDGLKQMPSGDDIYEAALGGPLFSQDLKFYLTGRINTFSDYNVFDNPQFQNNGLAVIDPDGNNLGSIPLTERYRRAATGKLSFDAFGFSVNANAALSSESDLLNGWGTLYEPEYYVPAEELTNNVYSLNARGQIGDGVLTLTGSYSINDLQYGLYDQTQPVDAFHDPQFLSLADNYTYNQIDNSITQGPDGIIDIYTPVEKQIPNPANPTQPYPSEVPGLNPFTGHIEGPGITQSSANAYGIVGLFTVVGNTVGFANESTTQSQFSGDYTVQVGSHLLKAGVDGNLMSVYRYDNQLPWDANPFKDSFFVHPYTGDIYVEDKMEFNDITFHPGLRLDVYQPDSKSIPDLYNPLGNPLVPTTLQTQLSPRLAITYAITDQTTFNFGYNWYFKQPSLNDVLTNTGGGNLQELALVLARGNQALGQASLQADQRKEVDVGFNTQLSDIFAFSVNGIYADIRNQDGLDLIASPLLPSSYTIYSSDQYGSDRSIELVAEKRMADNFSMKLNYTISQGQGTSSSATENYSALINQDPSAPTVVLPLTPFPFSYDRTNVLNFLFDISYSKGEGPTIFGQKLLQWFSLQTTTVYQTGTPYTATNTKGAQIGSYNGEREPDYFQTDLSLTRTIPFEDLFGPGMSKIFLDLQLEVTNIFNRTSPLFVYPATGEGNNDGNPNTFSTSTEYYNDPTNSRGGQIDALGNLYYDPRLDLNHSGVVTVAEQEIAYAQYRSDVFAQETNYQTPRRVWMNFTIRF